MEEIVTTTKKNVLAAAEDCATAKRVLEKLFPDAFPKPKELHIGDCFLIEKFLMPSMQVEQTRSRSSKRT